MRCGLHAQLPPSSRRDGRRTGRLTRRCTWQSRRSALRASLSRLQVSAETLDSRQRPRADGDLERERPATLRVQKSRARRSSWRAAHGARWFARSTPRLAVPLPPPSPMEGRLGARTPTPRFLDHSQLFRLLFGTMALRHHRDARARRVVTTIVHPATVHRDHGHLAACANRLSWGAPNWLRLAS